MQKYIFFAAIVACAAAAPGYLLAHETPVVHAAVPVLTAKTTISESSQLVNHGTPVLRTAHVVHAAPIVHAGPIVHAAPIVHATPVVHATPLLVKTAPSAVSHSSSVVSHTPYVKALPLLAVH